MINLAAIANAYNPILLVVALGLSLYAGIKLKRATGLLLLISALIVYSLMYLDKYFLWWSTIGLDYSTHTATALAMCLFIGWVSRGKIIAGCLAGSLLAYCQLMVVLNYHSWADIVSTAAPVGLLLGALYYFSRYSRLLTL